MTEAELIGTPAELATALAELHRRDGRGFAELAVATGLSEVTLRGMVKGGALPGRDALAAFVKACGESPAPWAAARERVATNNQISGTVETAVQARDIHGGVVIQTVPPNRRRRLPIWTLVVGAVVVAGAVGWGFIVTTSQPDVEPGDPVSLVGQAKAAGVDLEFALPDRLAAAPQEDALLRGEDDLAAPLLAGRRSVSVGKLAVSFQLKGNRRVPVQITSIAPEIISTQPVLTGSLVVFPPPGGEKPAIKLVANLDSPQPVVRDPAEIRAPWFSQHHVELAKDENQQFEITFGAQLATYSFRIVVEYSAGDGSRGRLVVTRPDGKPFTLTGKPADGRYGVVYFPNFPSSPGWHECGTWARDQCVR